MNAGCWKFNEENRVYIDREDESEEQKLKNMYSNWDQLPDILLEQIFSYLTIRERYYASLVCRNWYRAFKLQSVWSIFTLEDTTLTRGKFNYYSGWQYVLDHMRISACLNKVGRHFRCLIFEPMLNFYNLYEFMNMVSWYAEKQGSDNTSVAGVGNHIRRLKFTFYCNMANRDNPDRIRVFGTGGKLLEALKRLMINLKNIKSLELIDLMLDSKEALFLMDDICANCTESLTKLILINTTREFCPLLHVGVFLNLHTLIISPQNLHEDVVELIGHTKLNHLHIVQNRYSPKDSTIRLPKNCSWARMRLNNPNLKVHFEIECQKSSDLALIADLLSYKSIPVHSIILESAKYQVPMSAMIEHGLCFQMSLKVYAIKGLSRYYLPKNFSKRIDRDIVRFCRLCPNLTTLMIHDKISTSTILEIISTAKHLQCLYVRRNVILKRFDRDWSNITDWSNEHYQWIKSNSNCYERTEEEVSKVLGYRWKMLSEKEFKNQEIRLHI
ncbi:uncharacterized protein LOC127281876 isoform X2 [Leptopilina boulardi]|uniref:uncharacterized protein LOC127281876 isoform X2 n=1 Tax=Leptopilina boulardi TaxID=63433 RepID=UPI0021F59D3A|nr:uncharacterized protein LOC127281876 isoform X2 [Leptopilina boulardi]